MVSLRKAELTWNPDTDLLMSKLRDVQDEREADTIVDTKLRHLLNMLNLQCCCAESNIRVSSEAAETSGAIKPIAYSEAGKATSGTPPSTAADERPSSAPDQGDDHGDNIPTLTLGFPAQTRDDQAMAEALPKPEDLKPPVFSHDQTPYNSPRSSKKKLDGSASSSKSKEINRKAGKLNMSKSSLAKRRAQQGKNFVISEEDAFIPSDSDSDCSFQDANHQPRSQPGCCGNPLRRLGRS